jgi:CBS domain-containing protein
MTSDPISISPDQSVDEAARLLDYHRISGLPVVGDGRVVGVLSEADLIGKAGSKVSDVMTSPAITVAENTRLDEVASILTQRHIRRAPVVDGGGRLRGVVSRSDVLRWAAGRIPAA